MKRSKQTKKQAPKQKSRQIAPAVRSKKSSGMAQNVGSMIGGAIGNSLVPGAGGIVGGLVGKGLGALFKRITGIGDYDISVNSLYQKARTSSVPSFPGMNCIRVSHKEYLGDIYGSTSFNNMPFSLNPGLQSTFPWLSSIAANYEQYYINGLVVQFVSTSAAALNSTNTALGKVVMATEYNAERPTFTTTSEMLNTTYANYGKPAEDLIHAIECAPNQVANNLYYIRTAGVPNGSDPRLYDLGIFQLATEGMQASANIGGLWISYDVTLCKPILGNSLASMDFFTCTVAGTSSVFSSAVAKAISSPIGGTLASDGTYLFPRGSLGTYKVVASLSSAAPATWPNASVVNLKNVNVSGTYYNLNGYTNLISPGGTATSQAIFEFYLVIPGLTSQTTGFTLDIAVPGGVNNISYFEVIKVPDFD